MSNERCIACGQPENASIHIIYEADAANPVKHLFERHTFGPQTVEQVICTAKVVLERLGPDGYLSFESAQDLITEDWGVGSQFQEGDEVEIVVRKRSGG